MLRRPPTSIELKLDDIAEYEAARQEMEREQQNNKPAKPYNEPPVWQPGPKTTKEIHNRIGYGTPHPRRNYSPEY